MRLGRLIVLTLLPAVPLTAWVFSLATPISTGFSEWRFSHTPRQSPLWEVRCVRITSSNGALSFADFERLFDPKMSIDSGWIVQVGTSDYLWPYRRIVTSARDLGYREPARAGWMGFEFLSKGHRVVVIPYWALVLIASLPLLWSVGRQVRERRRRAAGMCGHCGYDLRASPERCRECGHACVPST